MSEHITNPTGLVEALERLRGEIHRVQSELTTVQSEVRRTERSLESGAVLGSRLRLLISLGMVVSIVFSAGVGYTMWMGTNATDEEVGAKIEVHDKDERAHPPIKQKIQGLTGRMSEAENTLQELREVQRRLDKRSEYQFEFTRWQLRVLEARQKRQKPPKKPARLEQLERELLLGF